MVADVLGKMCQALLSVVTMCRQACRHLCGCIQGSPLVFLLTAAALCAIVALLLLFNLCLVWLFTVPGAIFLNLVLLWLLLRLIVRALVFPGSIVFWKRNTEASYRVEISKQFACHLKHLHAFLAQATGLGEESAPSVITTSISVESVVLGCMVVQGLAHNFRLQQTDQVRFTKEQDRVRTLVQSVESWLKKAKVCEKRQRIEAEVALLDWLQRISRSLSPVPLSLAISNAPLESGAKKEGSHTVEALEELTGIFEELQRPKDNCCSNSLRFLREPTVGSLHQLRAELKTRYSGHHHWVQVKGGRKIDAMLIHCRDLEGGGGPVEENESSSSNQEDTPLKSMVDSDASNGPVIVWCNPNAAYYETMAYESKWLDFYLGHGCSVLLFNYSGFGRSQGNPTPAALAADGSAIIEFLKRRGYRQIGVHGRSIGGIAACSLANSHPDVVKILIADRTFSTLASAAKFTFGNWAVKGLSLSATWADNLANYVQARCYKVLVCDPRDATIPDLASLRTAVAGRALGQVGPDDKLDIDDDKIQRLADAWQFLSVLVSICDSDEFEGRPLTSTKAQQTSQQQTETKRSARQVVIGKPGDAEEHEDDTTRLVSSRVLVASSPPSPPQSALSVQWLEENVDTVRSVMAPHADNVRLALDIIGTQLNAGGMTLDEALGRGYDEPHVAMKAFLANMQVWGSLGSLREPLSQISNREVELLLSKGCEAHHSSEVTLRLSRARSTLTPEWLSSYHRQLSRALVAQVHQAYKQHMVSLSRAMETPPQPGAEDNQAPGAPLCVTTLAHLREVEDFLAHVYHFFKCVDTSMNGGGSAAAASVPASSGTSPGATAAAASATGASATGSGGSSGSGATAGEGATASTAAQTLGRAQDAADDNPVPGGDARPPQPAIDRAATGFMMCVECGHNGVLSEGELQHLSLHLRAARFGRNASDSARR